MIQWMPRITTFCMLTGLLCSCPTASGDDRIGSDPEKVSKAREKAIAFLKTSQADDGTWTNAEATGITALVTYGLLMAGAAPEDPVVDKALQRIVGLSQPSGAIGLPKSRIPAYETSIALMTLQAANKSGKYTPVVEKAEKFVRGVQFNETTKTDKSDPKYGGAGYGPGVGRPDMSNTVFFLEALQATGANKNDPAVQKAVIFLSRCQNLETEFNPGKKTVNDGGFFYSPTTTDGNSPAGRDEEGGPRSYGSMTYAGLKSMLYAGLTSDDERVQAALGWIKKHYSVEENPGMGSNGVFYYYYLFAKALSTLEQTHLEDDKGVKHDWRKELADHLLSLQQPNGSWVNSKATRWFEGDPNLVTAYVLVSLKYCEAPKK